MVYAGSSYLVCCNRHGSLTNDRLVLVTTDGESRTVYTSRGMGYGLGYLMDSRGCVLLFEGDWFETRLCLLRPGSAVQARDLMRDDRDNRFTVRCRIVFIFTLHTYR